MWGRQGNGRDGQAARQDFPPPLITNLWQREKTEDGGPEEPKPPSFKIAPWPEVVVCRRGISKPEV